MKRRRQHGKGSLFEHGRYWYMQYYVKGRRIKESTLKEKRDEAEQVLKRRLAEIELDQYHQEISAERLTIGDVCELVLADYRLRKKKELKIATWRFHRHLEKTLGVVWARRATTKHFVNYIEVRREKGASDASINRELAIVRRGYTLAQQQDPPLVVRVPYIPRLKEENVRQGFLEPEQYEQLLEALPLKLKALFVCAYHIGSRKGELRKLGWPQVDLENGVIRLEGTQTKNGKPREMPITGDMWEWLEFQKKTCPKGCEFVFHGAKRRPVSHRLDGWNEACEAVGLGGLYFHDMRRSAIRNLKRAGVQDSVAMRISGHLTRSVFDRYNITDGVDVTNAAKALEDYLKGRKRAARNGIRRIK